MQQQWSEPDIRHAPIELWRIAQWFLNIIYNLFGEPERIAARYAMTRKNHALITSWLRTGEALLRRLLLIEAAAIKDSLAQTRKRARVHARASESGRNTSPENSDAWRVSFRCLGRRLDRRRPRRRRTASKEYRFLSAWPLAARYEAMIRIFNTPLPYARRLARRLNAEPARTGELMRAPPEYERRTDAATLDEAAAHARRCWDSS